MQRKVFRIEQMLARRAAPAATRVPEHGALARELAAMQETISVQKRELSALVGNDNERKLARASDELAATIDSLGKATQTILSYAELIDDGAKSLAAAFKRDYERSLALDIQENVMKIYESCNFQDLAGQRIAKVMAMLDAMEERIATLAANGQVDALPGPKPGSHLINGPKLEGDLGHASQGDIDAMFN